MQPFGAKKKEIKGDLRLICWNVWFQNQLQGTVAKISEEIAQIFNALSSPGQSISSQLSIRTVIFNPGRYKKMKF